MVSWQLLTMNMCDSVKIHAPLNRAERVGGCKQDRRLQQLPQTSRLHYGLMLLSYAFFYLKVGNLLNRGRMNSVHHVSTYAPYLRTAFDEYQTWTVVCACNDCGVSIPVK